MGFLLQLSIRELEGYFSNIPFIRKVMRKDSFPKSCHVPLTSRLENSTDSLVSTLFSSKILKSTTIPSLTIKYLWSLLTKETWYLVLVFFKAIWIKCLQVIINVRLLKFHGFRGKKSRTFLMEKCSRLALRAGWANIYLSIEHIDLREGVWRTSYT